MSIRDTFNALMEVQSHVFHVERKEGGPFALHTRQRRVHMAKKGPDKGHFDSVKHVGTSEDEHEKRLNPLTTVNVNTPAEKVQKEDTTAAAPLQNSSDGATKSPGVMQRRFIPSRGKNSVSSKPVTPV